jgi:phytoene synthase
MVNLARPPPMRHLRPMTIEPIRAGELSPVAALVRRHDPDRFFTALFAPTEHREALFVLYAFNHELARAREVVREPMLALIRLQWWREVVEGARRRHEVAGPLGDLLAARALHVPDLLAMIAAREMEVDAQIVTRAEFLAYLDGAAGGLAVAAGRLLGAGDELVERLRELGAAFGLAGQLRSVAALAGQGRCLLPADVLGAHGLTVDVLVAGGPHDRLRPVLDDLATDGRRMLRDAGGWLPRNIIAAALPAVLARRDLRRPGARMPRRLGDRLAVTAAALAGRV